MVPLAPEAVPRTEERTSLAPQWKVLLHDDDTTTMEFVVWLLGEVFGKEPPEAMRLMLEVHNEGVALITVTTLERGELYLEQVRSLARPRGFPLVASLEPA
jgi:ATP-dependent Clp protease adaptor protein ClpS